MSETYDDLPEGSTLKDCGRDGYAALAAQWREQTFQPKAPILTADDPGDDVFFILAGRVRAATFTSSGREVTFADLAPGASFGEIAAVDGGARSTNVIALTVTRVARLSAERFNRVIDTNTAVMRAHLTYLARRVRTLSGRLLDITTMSARERLIAELLSRAETTASPDTAEVSHLPTQQELADLIFSQREAVGRDLSRLARAGLIRREGRRLIIPSLAALRDDLRGE